MGAGADGWWNDPVAAGTAPPSVAEWTRTHDDAVTLVFDGRPEPSVAELAGGNLAVTLARRPGHDAADDRIVELVDELYADEPDLVVVTAWTGASAPAPARRRRRGGGALPRATRPPRRPRPARASR